MIYFDTFGASGGVGRVSLELISAFRRLAPPPVIVAGMSHVVDSLAEAMPPREKSDYVNLTPPRFSWRRIPYEKARRTEDLTGGLFDYLWRELQRKVPGAANHPVLINYPQLLAPPRAPISAALFIHDLNWRSFPENFSDPESLDRRCRAWLEKSPLIFTNSNFTRDEILEAYAIEPRRVVAAPLAPFHLETLERSDDFGRSLAAWGLTDGPFYLYPAVHGAHKGHDILADALSLARETFPVVVTCGLPTDNLSGATAQRQAHLHALQEKFQPLIAQKRLIVLSHLSHREMDILRLAARAFVLPSLYEGYGFPLAEAISLRKPVLLSDIPAYAEILLRQGGNLPIRRYARHDSQALAQLLEADFAGDNIFTPDPTGGASTAWSWSDTAQTILTSLA